METKKKVPEVRFKGFSGEWEELLFSNLVVRVSSICKNAELPRVEYEDIISGMGRLNKNIYQKESSKVGIEFVENDVLYGKLRPYLKNWLLPSFRGIAVGDFWVLRSYNSDSKYVYYLIQTKRFEIAANQSTGTKMPRSDWSLVSREVFNIPINTIEQSRIGTWFQHLDQLITLHQKKYNKLTNIKKAMLEKMFPKNGADVPEIRFEGFEGKWEEKKLGDVADVTKLAGYEFTKYIEYSDEGTIIALRGLNVKNGTINLNDVKFIDQSDFSKLNRSKLFKADILFTYVGTIGELAIIPENNKFYLAPNVARFRLSDDLFSPFILQTIGSKEYYDKIISPLIATSSQPALSMENIRKFVLKLPVFKEQQKIGTYFQKLDQLITLQQTQIEKLQNIKKACLEKMFV